MKEHKNNEYDEPCDSLYNIFWAIFIIAIISLCLIICYIEDTRNYEYQDCEQGVSTITEYDDTYYDIYDVNLENN